jgi:hypothetical protein
MSNTPQFINYLFGELKDHLEQIKEEAFKESPDEDRVEYHFEKASSIIIMIEEQTKSKEATA